MLILPESKWTISSYSFIARALNKLSFLIGVSTGIGDRLELMSLFLQFLYTLLVSSEQSSLVEKCVKLFALKFLSRFLYYTQINSFGSVHFKMQRAKPRVSMVCTEYTLEIDTQNFKLTFYLA